MAQSGSTTNAFLFMFFQATPAVNLVWHEACKQLAECRADDFDGSVERVQGYIDSLANTSAVDLWIAMHSGPQTFWGAIPNDGTFLQDDPREHVDQKQLATNIPYFITTCSFEGSLGLLPPESFPGGFSFQALEDIITYSIGSFDIKPVVHVSKSYHLFA